MNQVVALLQLIGNLSAIALAIAAALAFVPRSFVQEWIKARFAREVERESREHAARLQKDLENYKNDLLRQLDEARLDIDLRRGIALQSAAAKLDAVRKLSISLIEHVSFALAIPQQAPQERSGSLQELITKSTDVMKARLEADIFLERAVSRDAIALIRDAHGLAAASLDGRPALAGDAPEIAAINEKVAEVSSRLHDVFQTLVTTGRVLPSAKAASVAPAVPPP